MRDPERLLSKASDLEPLERELLASLRDERAPEHVRHAAWQGIAGVIVAAVPASAAAAASGSLMPAAASGMKLGLAGKATTLLITKSALIAALSVGAVSGAIWVAARQPAPPPAERLQPKAAVASAPAPAPAVAPPQIPAAAAVVPEAPALPNPIKRPRVNALAAESALLQAARAELRAGSLAAAERTLGQLQRRFPHGVLSQEREVLRIEIARARGDTAGAQRLAARFLHRYPESPHAAQLSRLMAAP